MDVSEQITSKRRAAARARQLAANLASPDDCTRALVFADELEAEADVLEDQLISPKALP
jgi:hypothetical protein